MHGVEIIASETTSMSRFRRGTIVILSAADRYLQDGVNLSQCYSK